MTSQSNIFKKDQQEFEQGQIPSNNCSGYPFTLRGSADNGVYSQFTTLSNINAIDPKRHACSSPTTTRPDRDALPKSAKLQQRQLHLPLTFDAHLRNQRTARHDPRERTQMATFKEHPDYAQFYYRDQTGHYPSPYYPNSYYLNKNNQEPIQVEYQYGRRINGMEKSSASSNREYCYFNSNINNYKFDNKYQKSYEMGESPGERVDPRQCHAGVENVKQRKVEKQKPTEQKLSEAQAAKKSATESIQKCSCYFRATDWDRLLFIIQEIILDNNDGIKRLWNFMNKFKGKRRYQKGKKIFSILAELGLEQVFDKLIAEQGKYKAECKLKQTKIKSLAFKLIHKIE